jgi:hypothetical protein
MRRVIFSLTAIATIAVMGSGVKTAEGADELADGEGSRWAWKDADGWCPAGCDDGKYKCPCIVTDRPE